MRKATRLPWPVILLVTLIIGGLVGAGVGYLLVLYYQGNDVHDGTVPQPSPQQGGKPCIPRAFGYNSIVCVCNSTYCDDLPQVQAVESGKALVFTSSKAGLRMQREELKFTPVDSSSGQVLTVNRLERYQTILGFGGAFTDSTGINILSLPKEAQELLLRSYYSEDGLEYNLGRVPIGGTDFSTREYSYDDSKSPDIELKGFALQPEDFTYKIPMIHRAMGMMPASSGDLKLFSATWSPPAWMKTSNKLSGYGFLQEKFFRPYANYLIKFLEAYDAHNVTIYSVSTGNEPINGIIPFKNFNALGWWPKPERNWIKGHFGPVLRASRFKDVKLLVFDDQRIMLPWLLEMVLSDKVTSDYVDIIGYHWYLNFITPSSLLTSVHNKWPDKPIVNTEACNGDKPWDFNHVQLGSWTRGQYYLGDIVDVMNHWTTAWIDWNLALNMQGGPTWAKNYIDAPIIVDASRGEFYRNPTFYGLAHVSKFVRRNSVRVGASSKDGPWFGGKVKYVAFERPDKAIVVVLTNNHGSKHAVTVRDPERGDIAMEVPAYSFVTVIYW